MKENADLQALTLELKIVIFLAGEMGYMWDL